MILSSFFFFNEVLLGFARALKGSKGFSLLVL